MIFRNALVREFAGSALGVFIVLLSITATTQLVRLLGQAASGSLAVEGVLAMLGFAALGYLPVLMSLTLFISVLMTLTRSYHDSEMVVWFSSGQSLTAWIRPVLMFAAPLVAVIALLSLLLSPWALSKSEEFRAQLERRDEISSVAPGVFRESKKSERVYFVEYMDPEERQIRNIFVSSTQHGKEGVMIAREGHQEVHPNGDRFLVLINGRRYEGEPGSPEYRIMHFERYSMRIEAFEATRELPSVKSLSTGALLALPTPLHLGELSWRIGLPVSAMLLSLLAVPLAFVNPRAGRSFNLVLALLVYMIYSNCLSVAQAWVSQERISLLAGLWGVHIAMFGLLLLLYWRRLTLISIWRLFR